MRTQFVALPVVAAIGRSQRYGACSADPRGSLPLSPRKGTPMTSNALWPALALCTLVGCSTAPPTDDVRETESIPTWTSRPDWMGGLSATIGGRALANVVLPGTHDSGTATLTATSEVTIDAPDWLQSLSRSGGFLPVGIIAAGWSRAQGRAIPDQLDAGFRYLDLRICHASDGLRLCHGLAGERIETVLDQVNTFLSQHSQEIVILDFNHLYGLTSDDHASLAALIASTFGARLAPRSFDAGTTIAELQQAGAQAIVLYADRQTVAASDGLWYESAIVSPWANTTDPMQLQQWIATKPLARPADAFFVSQAILTPDSGTIQRGLNPFSSNPHNLQDLANTINPSVQQWIQDGAIHPDLNVIIADWVPDSMIATTIALNTW
jgi:hypothetical protein